MNEAYFSVIPSKIKKTSVLQKSPLVKPFIPETRWMTKENLLDMTEEYPMVIFKPDRGSGGRKIGAIYKANNGKFKLRYKLACYNDLSLLEVYNFIKDVGIKRGIILQRGIDLLKINDSPSDIRVFVQKTYDDWEVQGIVTKVGNTNKVVTNKQDGGVGIPFGISMALASINKEKAKKVKMILYGLGYHVADSLCSEYNGLRELGIDIGLDRNLWPWILEVNTKPKYELFKAYKDKLIYNKIANNHMIICNSIDYYKREEK